MAAASQSPAPGRGAAASACAPQGVRKGDRKGLRKGVHKGVRKGARKGVHNALVKVFDIYAYKKLISFYKNEKQLNRNIMNGNKTYNPIRWVNIHNG